MLSPELSYQRYHFFEKKQYDEKILQKNMHPFFDHISSFLLKIKPTEILGGRADQPFPLPVFPVTRAPHKLRNEIKGPWNNKGQPVGNACYAVKALDGETAYDTIHDRKKKRTSC